MEENVENFDVVVAGGGMAGVLAAARIALARPDLKLAILEREPVLGGRLRGVGSGSKAVHGYGLNAASDALFHLWQRTIEAGDSIESPDDAAVAIPTPVERRLSRIGVMAGGKIAEFPVDQWFTAKGARAMGGLAAAREWTEVEGIFRAGASAASGADLLVEQVQDADGAEADDDENHESEGEPVDKAAHGPSLAKAFAQVWPKTRKAASAVVLEHFALAFGIPDLWSATALAVMQRAHFHSGRLHTGIWDQAIQSLVNRPWFAQRVAVMTGTRLVDAVRENNSWRLTTDLGVIGAKSLVVAQPPWQVLAWLRRPHWPPQLLQVATKTKPVSAVVLADRLRRDEPSLPDVLMIPSEGVQAIRSGAGEICFQATIDYEMSLSAPAVVKAVRGAKRARKKLAAMFPDLIVEDNHIALLPVAWAQPLSPGERRWIARITSKKAMLPGIAFCGDAYGTSFDGDANLTASLAQAVDHVVSGLPPAVG